MSSHEKRLVTAALPYVNNIPHLGNLIQVLSADAYARFCRSAGYETFYICGTDEYGTATETKALELGKSPKDLCDEFYQIHKEIYEWFSIQFDFFGRTSSPIQTEVVQKLFLELDKKGVIKAHETQQFFCPTCDRFLADRFIEGTCPHCHYEHAKGDQCDNCGQLLDPTDLKDPHCTTCGSTPILKTTENLYLDLPAIEPALINWLNESKADMNWASNALRVTKNWLQQGLEQRAITRDLKWGIPVPKEGFENKVFYVWFDAPIGYISITKEATPDWEKWWKDPQNTKLVQFVGKDNIPFHSILFPSVLISSQENWTKVNQLASSEYLNYENTKFSKSKGIGIFGNDVQDTKIPADIWRYYLYAHRPEKADTFFLWHDFYEKVQADLIGNFGNFINRTLSLYQKFFSKEVEILEEMPEIWSAVRPRELMAIEAFEKAELKSALAHILSISDQANKQIQESEPWKEAKSNPSKVKKFLTNWIYVIRNMAILIEPFMPTTSTKIFKILNIDPLTIKELEILEGISYINNPEIIFEKIEPEYIESLKERFSGKQGERKSMDSQESKPKSQEKNQTSEKSYFDEKISLSVMKVLNVENHPEADKLFILELLENEEEDIRRTIVSGLVGIYTKEDLIGKKIVVVENLKKSKLRGVVSEGMLTAVSAHPDDEDCEVLMVEEDVPVGTRLVTEERVEAELLNPMPSLKADKFFSTEILAKEGIILAEGKPLFLHGIKRPVTVKRILNGFVG